MESSVKLRWSWLQYVLFWWLVEERLQTCISGLGVVAAPSSLEQRPASTGDFFKQPELQATTMYFRRLILQLVARVQNSS